MSEQTKTQEINFLASQLNDLKSRVEKSDIASQIGNNFLARFDEKLNSLSKTMEDTKIMVRDNMVKTETREKETNDKLVELEKDIANTKGKFWGIGLTGIGSGALGTYLARILGGNT